MIRRGERERKRGKKNVVVVVKFLRTFTVSVSVLAYFFLLLFRVLIFLEKIESKKGEENKKKTKNARDRNDVPRRRRQHREQKR